MSELLTYHRERLPPMMRLIGVDLVEVAKSRIVGKLVVKAEHGNGHGVLHGGGFMAFADHIGAICAVVNLPEGARTATIESKTNFFAPGRLGDELTAEATPLHVGRRTIVAQTRITDPRGRLLALVTQTQIVKTREEWEREQAAAKAKA